jgi:hypothetical protein
MVYFLILVFAILIWNNWDWLDKKTSRIQLFFKSWQNKQEIKKKEKNNLKQAVNLIEKAKLVIDQDTYNPFDTNLLSTAIDYYQKSYSIVKKDSCIQAIDNIQMEIDRRYQFQALFRTATENFHHRKFKEALDNLVAAKEIYAPEKLLKTINEFQERAREEDTYLQSLVEAKTLSYSGRFYDALMIVNQALVKFPCEDGESLKLRLSRVVTAKEQLNLGKKEQQAGSINEAKSHYIAALTLMPDWSEAKLRLAIINITTGESTEEIEQLANIDIPKVQYLKGLLYARQKKYKEAKKIWSTLDQDLVHEYWQIVADISLTQRQLIQPQIKQLIEQNNLEQAKITSLEFLEKFGSDLLIETNLKDCILPAIEKEIWGTEKLDKIVIFVRENWIEKRDIKSLHNLAVALYYSGQDNHCTIEELILTWSTAIANIEADPSLQNIPWLENKSLSLTEISSKLWLLLEQHIETIKNSNPTNYLQFRDRYRQEMWAEKLSKEELSNKFIIDKLTILPGFHQKYYSHHSLNGKPQVWKTLYTRLGQAVAACLDGDPKRSEVLQDYLLEVNSSLEEFARHFILYQQGYSYLQKEEWRSAIYPLNDIKNTINENHEWWQEIDELCAHQRNKISDFEEHLDFAQFWHDLLSSLQSEYYLIEYRALEIDWAWYNSIVSDQVSLTRIEDLSIAYPEHLRVQEIFDKIYRYSLENS